MSVVPTTYAFGDSETAALRLELVARLFAPTSRAFLAGSVDGRTIALAVDVGCGPGYSTRLLAETVRPHRTVGLDSSASFVELARARAADGVDFLEHDVTLVPFPAALADLAYCRFLLSHLAQPVEVLGLWATQLAPGGLLLLEEVESIRTADPVLRAYLEVVAAVVERRGGVLFVGPRLEAATVPDGLRRLTSRLVAVSCAPRDAARMFLLNMESWRDDPAAEVPGRRALARELARIADGGRSADVGWRLRQIVYEREVVR